MELEMERVQLERLIRLANGLQASVWSKDYFPFKDRPDFNFLVESLCIDDNPIGGPQLHPITKEFQGSPKWNRLHQAGMAQSHDEYLMNEAKKIAQYNPYTRIISFSERSLSLPDPYLLRFLAHEMATDTYGRAIITPYHNLTHKMKKSVDNAILRLNQYGIRLGNDIAVSRTGYTKHLFADNLLVAQISPPKTYALDEIYPTMFEIISAELAKVRGSVMKFERDILKGRLQIDPNEQHPHFVKTLFQALEYDNWRDLLHAFRQGNYNGTIGVLKKSTEYGEDIFASLFSSIEEDERITALELQRMFKGQ